MKKLNTLACILLLAYSNIYAFDGERKGFILGGGVGFGYLPKSICLKGTVEPFCPLLNDYRGVFLTNFKIGYAPSNTLEIFYINKTSWWIVSDITFLLGLSAAAFTVYFDNTLDFGWFVSGGIGQSTLSAPFESKIESNSGFGLFFGGGYEFSAHWNIEVDLLYYSVIGRKFDVIAIGKLINSLGVQVTVNVLAF